jgi:2-haloacid dehalogenase
MKIMQNASPSPDTCVFDAYGTLFDFASTVARSAALPGNLREPLISLWRRKQLEYSWLRSLQNTHADFWQVTADALDFAMASTGLDDQSIRDNLMDTWLALDTFSEVRDVLLRLRRMHIRTAILSNGSPSMLQAAVAHAGLQPLLDAVLSAEDAGIYKPHPKVYQLAVDRLAVDRRSIMFVSSNAWDACGASAFGMRVVWCNRFDQRPEKVPGRPDYEIRSLTELPFFADNG